MCAKCFYPQSKVYFQRGVGEAKFRTFASKWTATKKLHALEYKYFDSQIVAHFFEDVTPSEMQDFAAELDVLISE